MAKLHSTMRHVVTWVVLSVGGWGESLYGVEAAACMNELKAAAVGWSCGMVEGDSMR